MKSFNEYNKKVSWLDWEGMSHAELRNKVKKKKVSWLNIPNFDELRNKRKQENIKEESDITWEDKPKISGTFTHLKTYGDKINKHGEKYQDIHDHPDIFPQDRSDVHRRHIRSYCYEPPMTTPGSSSNINEHLRHLAGQPVKLTGTQGIQGPHSPEKVKQAIKDLSATFHDNTTNRMPLKTYSGVPRHIGEHLEQSGTDVKHYIPGFLSTSTNVSTAAEFARTYYEKDSDITKTKHHHVLQIHVHPGVGRSVAHESSFPENEVLLHHGTEMTYSQTTEHTDEMGNKYKMHHVIAHPTRIKLEDYGKV
jgi:hypothetical protein